MPDHYAKSKEMSTSEEMTMILGIQKRGNVDLGVEV